MHRSNPNPSFHVSTHATIPKPPLNCNHLLERVGVSAPPRQEERQANCLKDWAIVSSCVARLEVSRTYHVREHQLQRYQEVASR